MTNVVIFKPKAPMSIAQKQQSLTNVVFEIFADKPYIDLMLAIGAGSRAIERGTSLFEAVEIAEGVLKDWEAVVFRVRNSLFERRNQERLAEWQIKQSVWRYLPERISK